MSFRKLVFIFSLFTMFFVEKSNSSDIFEDRQGDYANSLIKFENFNSIRDKEIAIEYYGFRFRDGDDSLSIEENIKKNIKQIRILSREENERAMCNLGVYHANKISDAKTKLEAYGRFSRAKKWFQKASYGKDQLVSFYASNNIALLNLTNPSFYGEIEEGNYSE